MSEFHCFTRPRPVYLGLLLCHLHLNSIRPCCGVTHTVVWLLLSTAARLTIRRSALLGCNLLSALLCLVYLHVSFAGEGLVATVKYVSVSSRVIIHCPFRVLCRGFPSAVRGTGIHASSAPRDPFLVAGCRCSTVYPPHTFVSHRWGILKCDTCSVNRRTRAADPSGPPWSVPPSSVSALCHPSVPDFYPITPTMTVFY